MVLQRTGIAVPRQSAIDQVRPASSRGVVVDAERGRDCGMEVVHQNIGLLNQAIEGSSAIIALQIEHD